MGATALFKGFRARGAVALRRRGPSRVAVLAWATAFVALAGAGISALMERPGAKAMVVAMAPEGVAPTAPAEPLLDPTQYRKPPPPADGRPRIAVIFRGLGISGTLTKTAISDLPADVTLALSPYAHDLQKTADAARQAGHEVFLDMPMEPSGYPANDAGPQAVLTSISAEENIERLGWSMARFTGYAGVVLAAGSPALDSATTLAPILTAPAARGLVWAHIDARGFEGARVENARVEFAIDDIPKAEAIGAALERLEAKARKNGSALAVALPYPTSLDAVARWAATLEERGLVLVPASALATKPVS